MPESIERYGRLQFLSRVLAREQHVLLVDPDLLAPHVHNMFFLDGGEAGGAEFFLDKAREALAGRRWLRLANRQQRTVRRFSLVRLLDHGAAVNAVGWSPDGSRIASAGRDGYVRVWEVRTGRLEREFACGSSSVLSLAWSPAGNLLASGGSDRTIRIWNLATGLKVGSLDREVLDGLGQITVLAWSPDVATLAAGGTDRAVRLWELATGKITTIDGSGGEITALAWSPDARFLVWGDTAVSVMDDDDVLRVGGGVVRIYDSTDRTYRSLFETKSDRVTSLMWSPRGTAVVFASWQSVGLFDIREESQVVWNAHQDEVMATSWSPDGDALASAAGHEDRLVRVWSGDRCVGAFEGHEHTVKALAWSPDGRLLASGGWDGSVRLWDLEVPGDPSTSRAGGWMKAAAWSPDGTSFATLGVERSRLSESATTRVRRYDPETGEELSSGEELPEGVTDLASTSVLGWAGYEAPPVPQAYEVTAFALSPGGNVAAWAGSFFSDTHDVFLWNRSTGEQQRLPRRHAGRIEALAWSPGDAAFASGGRDGAIHVWSGEGRHRITLRGHRGSVRTLAWFRHGALLASGGDDRTVRVWDLASGGCVARAYCLSPVLAVQVEDDVGVLRSADDGSATRGLALPYLWTMMNFGPPAMDRGL